MGFTPPVPVVKVPGGPNAILFIFYLFVLIKYRPLPYMGVKWPSYKNKSASPAELELVYGESSQSRNQGKWNTAHCLGFTRTI